MENLKLPAALVFAMVIQIAGGVWWVSQQAATIADLEETVSQLGSRMAIEDNVNLKRDVIDNAMEIEHVWNDVDDLWHEIDGLMVSIGDINGIKQRITAIETELKYISRDHEGVLDMKGGMK